MILFRGLILIFAILFYACSFPTLKTENLEAPPPQTPVQFFYESQGGRVEGYLIRPKGSGPFPLIVLLHGHSWRREGAKRIIPVAGQFSIDLCYVSLAISLPSYGMTEVEGNGDDRDLVRKVVVDGISAVRNLPWVDRERVMLYGSSRGAVFAATLVGRIQGLRGIILHSGAYDIDRLYQDTPSHWIQRTLNPNGETNPALFSVLPEVADWTAPTLILHGGKDQLIPVNQAYMLRDRLEASGKPHRFVVFPDAGHRLPLDGVRDEVLSFLSQHVGSACERS